MRVTVHCFNSSAKYDLGEVMMSVNERIGKYRLFKILARSAFGTVVYLAFDVYSKRQVEIKVSRKLEAPEEIQSFLAGAPTLAKFNHPQIVPIYDFGRTEEGRHFVVSKFIDGHTLREKIRNKRPTPEKSATLVATIAETLQYAHQQGVIHRNVNPSNVLHENKTGNLYITGFGRSIPSIGIEVGCIFGTPSYMSPEQIRGENHLIDGRSDIFSLGVVFYELLTGMQPFRSSTTIELLNQVISIDPVPPRKVNRTVPVELNRICLKALAKQRSHRYSAAAELADDLINWQTIPTSWWSRFRRRSPQSFT